MKSFIFAFLTGTMVVLLQVTSFGFTVSAQNKPDLFLILVVWSSVRLSFAGGVGFSFFLGIVADMLSGSPIGLFGLIYCLLFTACGYLNATMRVDTRMGRALMVLAGVPATGSMVLLVRWVGGPVEIGWQTVQWFVVKSLVTTAIGLALFPLLDGAWRRYSRLVGEGYGGGT